MIMSVHMVEPIRSFLHKNLMFCQAENFSTPLIIYDVYSCLSQSKRIYQRILDSNWSFYPIQVTRSNHHNNLQKKDVSVDYDSYNRRVKSERVKMNLDNLFLECSKKKTI